MTCMLLSPFPLTDLVVLPKKETLTATLIASSIASTVSLLGLDAGLSSAAAAIAMKAEVAFTHMGDLFIMQTPHGHCPCPG